MNHGEDRVQSCWLPEFLFLQTLRRRRRSPTRDLNLQHDWTSGSDCSTMWRITFRAYMMCLHLGQNSMQKSSIWTFLFQICWICKKKTLKQFSTSVLLISSKSNKPEPGTMYIYSIIQWSQMYPKVALLAVKNRQYSTETGKQGTCVIE